MFARKTTMALHYDVDEKYDYFFSEIALFSVLL